MLRSLMLIFSLLLPMSALAEGKSIIVLDASGSMWGQIDGRPKLEIAREALKQVLTELPAGSEVGLMAYGHREKGSCEDIELLVPPGVGTGPAIAAAADSLNFLGKTPLTEAVRRAASELRSSEEKATVILITDGIETCQADPCALGRELEASGVDFTAHVVGFGLTADEGKQVACLAEETGGRYIQASDLGTLSEALAETVIEDAAPPAPAPVPAPAPEPAKVVENLDPSMVLVAGGPEVDRIEDGYFEVRAINADGSTGDSIATIYGTHKGEVPPGTYRILATLDSAHAEAEVTVTDTAVATPELVLNAGAATIRLFQQEGVPIEENGSWELQQAGQSVAYEYKSTTRVVPAGDYDLRAAYGAAEVTLPFSIKAGEEKVQDVILGTGHATIDAIYAEGVAVEDSNQFIEILSGKADIAGNRASITNAYAATQGFDLPAGDYLARVTLGATTVEVPFAIKTGQETKATALLNAGVAAFTVPGGGYSEVLSAKKDIAGNRKSLAFEYKDAWQTTLPAGDYVLQATFGEVKTDTPFTVKAGERTELTATTP
ncbi:vWA domain-containing protein [Fuscibacter oryzae]|uniref:VWA domain-containing protein n=1 Tax=Fuscibacter oryzae TaxID=2803939 RepID=A0A8J7MNB1_9RHOB|nr:VWA domain-containing protein [Fuscibacter oryzae]MBL4928020.1 VWA domain-containing protein [Fuscibacter oryzae]